MRDGDQPMTTNPCTSCKHYKPELTCKLTGLSTSQSRAYKTDKDDCFDSRWRASELNGKQRQYHLDNIKDTKEPEIKSYLYGDFNKDGK